MPRKSTDKDPPTKSDHKKGSGDIPADLEHLRSLAVADQSGDLGDSDNGEIVSYQIYRLGPKSITKGRRQYLRQTWEPPDAEDIKSEFGGGDFYIQKQVGGKHSAAVRISIGGEPKIAQDPDQDPMKLSELPPSADPVVNALVRQFESLTNRILTDLKELQARPTTGGGFDPDSFRKMIAVARQARYEDYAMRIALGKEESEAPTVTEKVVNDRVGTMMEILTKGIEIGQGKAPSDQNGLMEILAPIVQKVLQGQPVPVGPGGPSGPGGPGGPAAMPPIAIAGSPDDATIEQQRQTIENNTVEMRQEVLAQKLKRAVSTMLNAIEADNDYTDDQIIEFIFQAITRTEVGFVVDALTFDNVRLLMQQDPDDQIALDNNRERVETILSKIIANIKS